MDHKDLEYFRKLLSGMLEEAKQKGDSTLEELTDSNEVFAGPADRATAESDRAFTLRIRDRERRLIRKIRLLSPALTMVLTGFAKTAATTSASPAQGPACDAFVHQLQGQAGRRRTSSRRLTPVCHSGLLF